LINIVLHFVKHFAEGLNKATADVGLLIFVEEKAYLGFRTGVHHELAVDADLQAVTEGPAKVVVDVYNEQVGHRETDEHDHAVETVFEQFGSVALGAVRALGVDHKELLYPVDGCLQALQVEEHSHSAAVL